jgi:hypothetical protein
VQQQELMAQLILVIQVEVVEVAADLAEVLVGLVLLFYLFQRHHILVQLQVHLR